LAARSNRACFHPLASARALRFQPVNPPDDQGVAPRDPLGHARTNRAGAIATRGLLPINLGASCECQGL